MGRFTRMTASSSFRLAPGRAVTWKPCRAFWKHVARAGLNVHLTMGKLNELERSVNIFPYSSKPPALASRGRPGVTPSRGTNTCLHGTASRPDFGFVGAHEPRDVLARIIEVVHVTSCAPARTGGQVGTRPSGP